MFYWLALVIVNGLAIPNPPDIRRSIGHHKSPKSIQHQLSAQVRERKVQAGLQGMTVPLRVAVMGCVVNGPGEAREADLGVASGNGKGQIFVRGEVIKTVPESMIVETLIEEAMRLAQEMEAAGVATGMPTVDVG